MRLQDKSQEITIMLCIRKMNQTFTRKANIWNQEVFIF